MEENDERTSTTNYYSEEEQNRRILEARNEIVTTIEAHCNKQIGVLQALRAKLEDRNNWSAPAEDDDEEDGLAVQNNALEELDACIELYRNAKANAESAVKAALESEFSSGLFRKKFKPNDMEDFLRENRGDINKLTNHIHGCTAEVAAAESAAMKFLDQKLPVKPGTGTQTLINTTKGNFETESKHFKKKVGLCILGAVLIIAAGALLAASHGLLGPVAKAIAAKGVAVIGGALKMSAATTQASVLAGAGVASLAGAAAYHVGGDKKLTAEHMKDVVQEMRDDDKSSVVSSTSSRRASLGSGGGGD